MAYSLSYSGQNQDYLRQDFVSYQDCLIQFRLKYSILSETDITLAQNQAPINGAISSPGLLKYKFDTLSILVRTKTGELYYEFDKFAEGANLIGWGSKEDYPGLKVNDTSFIKNCNTENDAKDTIINGINFKFTDSMLYQQNEKWLLRRYFVSRHNLNTVFNLCPPDSNQFQGLCLAGYEFISDNNKQQAEGIILTKIREIGVQEKNICSYILNKIQQHEYH